MSDTPETDAQLTTFTSISKLRKAREAFQQLTNHKLAPN